MVLEDVDRNDQPHVVIYGQAETLVCEHCGREYVSRGKHDPGICRECERDMQPHYYVGGPLDGQVAK